MIKIVIRAGYDNSTDPINLYTSRMQDVSLLAQMCAEQQGWATWHYHTEILH